MTQAILFVGLDVDSVAFHGFFSSDDGRMEGPFSCKPTSGALIRKLEKLREKGFELRVCYEAGYLGFLLQRDLSKNGYTCEVIAPSLIPKAPGDQVKTNRLDAEKLTRYYKSGLLTPVHIPTPEQEAVRDLVRSRKFLSDELKGVKTHITALCQRIGLIYRELDGKSKAEYWTSGHLQWLESQSNQISIEEYKLNINYLINHMKQIEGQITLYDERITQISQSDPYAAQVKALCCFRGISILTSMTLISEIGDIRRFDHPRRLASYAGIDLREYSSGDKAHRFSITKMGNQQIRTSVVESCQFAFSPPRISSILKRRREGAETKLVDIADRCMARLHKKASRLLFAGKNRNKVKVACARELLCFVWEALTAAQAMA